jgi:cell division protein FtsI/penicillin-binding protein 2
MKNVILFLLILFSSCSTRKVAIDKVKKDSLSQISTKIGTNETIKIETKNDIIIDEFTIMPFDTCKDIVVNGITYKNAILRYKKTKDNTIQVKDKKTSKIEQKKQTTKVEIETKNKETEKKTIIPWWIYLLLAGGLYLIYLDYKL